MDIFIKCDKCKKHIDFHNEPFYRVIVQEMKETGSNLSFSIERQSSIGIICRECMNEICPLDTEYVENKKAEEE